jgi:HlyD family secretion protein
MTKVIDPPAVTSSAPAPPVPLAPPPAKQVSRTGARVRILLAALALIAILAGLFVWWRAPAAVTYLTVKADRGDIDATVTTTGNLNAVITVQVGSQVSGNILALYADFNTKVTKGQLVAQIDPAPFQAQVDQATGTLNAAKAAVVSAQASVSQAQANLVAANANTTSQRANLVKAQSATEFAKVANARRQVMVTNGSTSQEDADTSRAAYDQALASQNAGQSAIDAAVAAAAAARQAVDVTEDQLDQAKAIVAQNEAALSQTKLNLSHTKILAPVDGTVESRNMDVGQTVAASFAAPVIFLIAQDLTKMQVDTNVDESDVGRIQLGQSATFTVDAWPGRTFRGQVSQIREAPINVQNVITYDVVILVANDDLKLFPGMTANATIFTGHASNALRVPKAALRFRPKGAPPLSRGKGAAATQPDSQVVFVLDAKGQPKQVALKSGISDANYLEVTGGDLTEGQAIITGSSQPAGSASTRTATPAAGSKKFGI